MNAQQLQPGVRYCLPATTKRGGHEIGVPTARFARRIWSVAQDEHWYLFVAGTGREVWLPREDIAGCELEMKWAACGACGWVGLNEDLPLTDGPNPYPCGKKCPECGRSGYISCRLSDRRARQRRVRLGLPLEDIAGHELEGSGG